MVNVHDSMNILKTTIDKGVVLRVPVGNCGDLAIGPRNNEKTQRVANR